MCLTTASRRRPVLLQHLLDQIDAPARAIELVAEQHIGRTGRGAEAAMHAGAQDLVGLGDVGIGQLGQRKFGLHAALPRSSPAAVEDVFRIEAVAHPLARARASPRPAAGTRRPAAAPPRSRAAAWRDRPRPRRAGAPARPGRRPSAAAPPRSGRRPNRRSPRRRSPAPAPGRARRPRPADTRSATPARPRAGRRRRTAARRGSPPRPRRRPHPR